MKNLPRAVSWDELRARSYYGELPKNLAKSSKAIRPEESYMPSTNAGEWVCSICGMRAETKAEAEGCCNVDGPSRQFMPKFIYTVYTQEEKAEVERLVFAGLTPKMIAKEMGKVHQDEVSAPYQAARRKVMKAKGLLTAKALKRWQDRKRKAAGK